MIEIASLHVYPIKSLAGVALHKVQVQTRGLEFDRRWMLVEEDGRFITQRNDPSLVRFRIAVSEDGIEVSTAQNGSCLVPFAAEGPSISVQVWKSELPAPIVSEAVDAWFSEALGRTCHLVSMPDDAPRRINPDYGDSPVSFADAMPILVLSESSLEDLNQRLFEAVPIDRFRANIILRGTRPYEEDSATRLVTSGVELFATKRCGRCLVTCTDQITGDRATEPLRTLANYRLYNNNACMGMYFAPRLLGQLSVGDLVDLDVDAPTESLTSPLP